MQSSGPCSALGLHRLGVGVGHWSAHQVKQPQLLSFVEWDRECQEELKVLVQGLGQPDCCLFGDITAFFRPELGEIIQELKKKPSMAVEVLGPIMSSRKAMRRKSYCLVHEKDCFLKTAREHTAGSSCTAHSRQGKQLGLCDGNVLSLLAWIGLRLEVQETEITLENVPQFPTETLNRLLGTLYHVEAVNLDPRMFGPLGPKIVKVCFCVEGSVKVKVKVLSCPSHCPSPCPFPSSATYFAANSVWVCILRVTLPRSTIGKASSGPREEVPPAASQRSCPGRDFAFVQVQQTVP